MSVRKQRRTTKQGRVREFWIVDVEFRRADGSVQRVRKVPRKQTRVAAESLEREIVDQLQAGTYGVKAHIAEVPTLRVFSEEFVNNYAVPNNKPSEVHTKRVMLRCHLLPVFGDLRLDEIGIRQIQAYKADKLMQGYSQKSLNNQLGVLSTLLRVAKKWEVIQAFPDIAPGRVEPPVIEFLTYDEVDRLTAKAEGQWHTMITVALNTGMRLGELLALRWDAIDLVAGKLQVRASDWKGVVGTPKGGRSREIPLNARALAALKAHRHLRSELVFVQRNGKRLTYDCVRSPLRLLCRRAGVKDVQWHALRHTFASHLVMKGVPLKAVQELLGHTTQRMTERYAHLTPDVRRDAVGVLDAVFGSERQPSGNADGGRLRGLEANSTISGG